MEQSTQTENIGYEIKDIPDYSPPIECVVTRYTKKVKYIVMCFYDENDISTQTEFNSEFDKDTDAYLADLETRD